MWDVIFCTFSVYTLYLLFGGFLFVLMEHGYEFENVDIKDDSFKNMKSLLSSNNFLYAEIDEVIEAWTSENINSYFGMDREDPSRTWNFLNGFIFSFYLCTTIGYGNLVPHSVRGQLLSVAYGALGVPLNLLFLKILGAAFLQAHRDTHWKVRGERAGRCWTLLADAAFFASWVLLLVFLPAAAFVYLEEGWSFLDAVYFTFITFSTIGLGDYVAGGGMLYRPYYQLLLLWWVMHGMAFLCMVMDVLARLLNRHCLFSLKYEQGRLTPYRTSVDAERLDLHFRLTNYPGLKYSVDFWGDVGKSEKADVLHQSHLRNLAHLAEKLRGLLGAEAQRRGGDMEDAFPVRGKKPPEPAPTKAPKERRSITSKEPTQGHATIRYNRTDGLNF